MASFQLKTDSKVKLVLIYQILPNCRDSQGLESKRPDRHTDWRASVLTATPTGEQASRSPHRLESKRPDRHTDWRASALIATPTGG